MTCCAWTLSLLLLGCLLLSSTTAFRRPRLFRAVSVPTASALRSTTTSTSVPVEAQVSDRVIVITDKAMSHLSFLRSKQEGGGVVTLRMGVRAGGCSGMSYLMDFIKEDDVTLDDHVEEYSEMGIKCVVDPKSLLFLYGLQLDYSDELIGGGFKFTNPNAGTSCGCGKSFGV